MTSFTATLPNPKPYILRKVLKYWAIAKVNIQNSLAYSITIFARSLLVVSRIWVLYYLYVAIYSSAHSEVINQLTLPMAIWNVSLSQTFQSVTRPPVARVIEEEIKSGTIVYSINRPYSYILFHLLSTLGKILPTLLTSLLIGGIVTWLLIGPIYFSLNAIVFGTLTLLLGYILDFFIMFNIGLAAFWLEDISSLYWNYFKLQFIFGGVLIPVALFPATLRSVAEFLPFSQLFYTASRLLVNFDWQLFYYFLTIQLTWIIILGIVSVPRFRKALKYVSINGG